LSHPPTTNAMSKMESNAVMRAMVFQVANGIPRSKRPWTPENGRNLAVI
jgi:hypothetical protein